MRFTTSRRKFLKVSAATGAGMFTGVSLAHAAPPQNGQRPTNVVMILSDDQGWTDFGFMGHNVIRTPRLDQLAKESAVFPWGYVPVSLCRASLATLLTGLYPHQHNICCNDPPDGVDRARMHPFIRNAPTLPRLLGQSKYASLQTGKFWEGHYSNAGFTDGETTNADRHIARKRPQIGRATMRPIFDFVDKHRSDPFFVWYAPMMPHYPHTPPERLLKRYRNADRDLGVAKYFAMCEWFDETCGQLLDHLDKRKLRDSTLIVFAVDNGWIQPPKPEKRRGPFGAPRGKRSPYEGGVRTPVILRWPNHTRAGRYNDLVTTVDLAPTILRACGQKPPNQMTGLNLLDRAGGKAALNRNAVYGEIYNHDCTVLGKPNLDVTFRWIRETNWKLIEPANGKNIELFDVSRDPEERMNLAGKQPQQVKRLRQLIRTWVANR